jgi:DNA recombination protein Rad52
MGFDESQIRHLRARLHPKYVRERDVEGTTIRYLEGAHVIGEANRIFGFDSWSRETVEARCVYTKRNGDLYSAAYVARVRVTVFAGDRAIVREGSGAGEATTSTPGTAHEHASKAAETDATKRALVTFGNRFGLVLYRGHSRAGGTESNGRASEEGKQNNGIAPRTSRNGTALTGHIEKSELTFGEPKRLRNPAHLRYVASQPCAVCGRGRSQAHHITFAQPRALGRKVSDEFTVPLCAKHHRELHDSGSEKDWWNKVDIDPGHIARDLWERSAKQ